MEEGEIEMDKNKTYISSGTTSPLDRGGNAVDSYKAQYSRLKSSNSISDKRNSQKVKSMSTSKLSSPTNKIEQLKSAFSKNVRNVGATSTRRKG